MGSSGVEERRDEMGEWSVVDILGWFEVGRVIKFLGGVGGTRGKELDRVRWGRKGGF